MRINSRWKFSLALLIAALIVNIAVALVLRSHGTVNTIDSDEREYWDIATGLLRSGLASIPARRTLPYPLLIAALRTLVGDDYLRVQLALSTLLSPTPVVLYWVAIRRLTSERVARLAAVLTLLWPPFVRYAATIYSDSFALLLFLVFLLLFPLPSELAAVGHIRWRQWLIAGAMLGICLLTKPLYLLYAPIAFLLAAFSENLARRRVLAALLLTLGCLASVLPWSTYISRREGQFILVSANDGETLAGGLNPALIKMDHMDPFISPEGRITSIGPGKWLAADATGYLSASEQQLPYTDVGRLLSERAHAWIRSHPREAAYLTARKLLYMWGIYPFWNGASQTLLGNLPLLLLVAAAGISLWRYRHSSSPLAIFWTLPILSTLVALVSWGSWRFRMPADVGLIVLAAALTARAVPPFGNSTSSSASLSHASST
jgi:4-amino-4-deoxy-L-arabinose transferase-like glycosyltransferase